MTEHTWENEDKDEEKGERNLSHHKQGSTH
jgi:hypothetical protein